MQEINRRRMGALQEQKAVQYLEEQGYRIIRQNYWTRFAELDIIAREKEYLCFVEVKYRANAYYGAPEGVITSKKMRRMGKAAEGYMMENRILPDTPMRFDVILILGEEITLIRNAFEYKT